MKDKILECIKVLRGHSANSSYEEELLIVCDAAERSVKEAEKPEQKRPFKIGDVVHLKFVGGPLMLVGHAAMDGETALVVVTYFNNNDTLEFSTIPADLVIRAKVDALMLNAYGQHVRADGSVSDG